VASVERSLARLRTDYVDLLQLHNAPLEAVRAGGLREALAGLEAAGKVRAWGFSARARGSCRSLGGSRCAGRAANFNMMDVRALDRGLFEEAGRRGAGLIGRTPLCFGFLSGTITRDAVISPGDHRLGWSPAQLDNWIDGAIELLAPSEPGRALPARKAPCASAWRFPAIST